MTETVDTCDLKQPDETRPAKRMRLEAPLDVTTDTRDEMQDEDDWDDVYDSNPTKQSDATASVKPAELPDPSSSFPAPANVMPLGSSAPQANGVVKDTEQLPDGVPIEAISQGDELVGHPPDQPMLEPQEERVRDETTNIVRDAPVPQERGLVNGAQDAAAGANVEDPPAKAEGTTTDKTDVQMLDTTGLPSRPEKVTDDAAFMAAAATQKGSKESEWQFDSSDAESSSDSDTSSDDSSDEDSGSENAYELLDPATAAKMLMADDGNEDGEKKQDKDYQPRTANEVNEEVIPKPEVTITPDMKITLLGNVSNTVCNMILVKGVTPGEYQVLESGSVLCNENREVVGAVAETFGRVQEPLYSVAFTNADEIKELGLEFGSRIYYVDSHSTFVFTQPLKNLKGTDASNIHDEEVHEDEQEFSDDEKEAEFKRQRRDAKKAGRGGLSRSAFVQGRHDYATPPASDDTRFTTGASDVPSSSYGGGLSYDDDEPADEFYAPLKRPDNLSELMAGGVPPRPQQSFDRGRGRGRGDRGDRGRGRGRSRGGFDSRQQRGGGGPAFRGQQPHRGPRGDAHAHSNRHSDNASGNHTSASTSYSVSAQQQYQAQPQPQQPQTYQFNGYQFQYGNAPQPAPTQQYPNYYAQQAQQAPGGSYADQAYYAQQQAAAYAAYAQQCAAQGYAAQQPPQAQPGAAQQQNLDIGAILRNLGHQQPPQ
ncbi:H/ACA ribonucleoprotein complex non-core subunit NAF1 [Cercospora zeina]